MAPGIDTEADGLDRAGRLVAEDHRQRIGKLALNHLEIGVTEAGRTDAHQDLAGAGIGEGDSGDGKRRADPFQHRRPAFHVQVPEPNAQGMSGAEAR